MLMLRICVAVFQRNQLSIPPTSRTVATSVLLVLECAALAAQAPRATRRALGAPVSSNHFTVITTR